MIRAKSGAAVLIVPARSAEPCGLWASAALASRVNPQAEGRGAKRRRLKDVRVLIVEAYEEEPLVLKMGPLTSRQSDLDGEAVNRGRGLLNLNSREIAFGPVDRPETHRTINGYYKRARV